MTAARRLPARAIACVLGVAVTLAWAGCTEATAPGEPFSLEFAPLPAPSIVSGDTLRDINGNAVALQATAFDFRGRPIDDAPISYVIIDTSGAVTLDAATGYLVATGPGRGTVRVVASAGAIQSAPVTLEIVPQPSAAAQYQTIDTLRYSFSNPALNTSDALEVRVTRDSANAPVRSYVVTFRLADLTDTVVARLVDDGDRRSPLDPSGATAVDTTEASGARAGVAGRRIRLTPSVTLATPVDSIVVLADVRYRGAHVTGSPVRLVLFVTPRTVTAP